MSENSANNNYFQFMTNPRAFTLKKWFYDLLNVDYAAHDAIIERVAQSLATQKDLEDFGKLVGQVFDKGYRRAVEDYRKEVEKLGVKISVVTPTSETTG